MKNELDKVKIELINLYLNIKIRTQEEVNSLTEENIIQETENIINLPLLDIIEYIKSTIDIIVSIKVESKINDYRNSLNEDNNAATEYETLLQKLESALRQHIAYEHQFKIEYEKLLMKSDEVNYEKNLLENIIAKLEKENKALKKNEANLKEQIETKEKELIQAQIKLKELRAINSANNFYHNNTNTNNNNNYRTKSYISKSNSSINIYKDNLTEKKDSLLNNNINKTTNNNSLLNNMKIKNRYTKIKKNYITNPNITLNNLTLSLQNIKKMSNSKTKHKKKYNNSTNYFNKKYMNNLTTILFIKEPKNKFKKKERNKSLYNNKNNRNMNKSMLDLFPSRNLNYLFNNNNNNKKYINNNYNINNYNINNNSNKRKKTKSLNITHNTINMNKNSVLINLNANIINTKTPIENYKVQQKLMEYKKYLNKKLNEFTKKNKKNVQIIPPPSNKNYKKINKYFKKNNNKRKISPYQNVQNIKLNFNSNNSSRKNKTKKNNFDFYTNIILKPTNIFNNVASRSSSTNSKSSMNIAKKSNKNYNKTKLTKKKTLTLKNFVFSKK